MKNKMHLLLVALISIVISVHSEYKSIALKSEISNVQPFTGIVFWTDNENNRTDAIQLEFSYMLYSDVVKVRGVYNWSSVDSLLSDIASRKHQAVLRFRYSYPGYTTAVPQYIKQMTDYHETSGLSEGLQTDFPDWQNEELKKFTLEFYTKFAERYDNDPRLAFIQTGFGLWAEYHIYDGPCIVGKTFPDKDFQAQFFRHLDTTFKTTPWSVSIDAADTDLSPFQLYSNLKSLHFGLFDDSFLSEDHGKYNTDCWNFFDRKRYLQHPAGGEFSYYTDTDQKLALSLSGPHAISFETDARNFHISYMIGNDQPAYQTMSRIKDAGLACGYKFRIEKFQASEDSSIVEVKNTGIAPLYYDAFITINKIRAKESLKFLAPESTIVCHIAQGGPNPTLTIECDRLIAGQKIEFEADLSATPVRYKRSNITPIHNRSTVSIYTPDGKWVASQRINDQYTSNNIENFIFSRYHLSHGVYLISVADQSENIRITKQLFIK